MRSDIKLVGLGIAPSTVLAKLGSLEIHTVRQLFARMQAESGVLRDYLGFSEEEFSDFSQKVREVIRTNFPEDTLPQLRPQVNKRGVAVHRLDDPSRPKFYKEKAK